MTLTFTRPDGQTAGWTEGRMDRWVEWGQVHSIAKRVDSDLFLARSGCGLLVVLAMYVGTVPIFDF